MLLNRLKVLRRSTLPEPVGGCKIAARRVFPRRSSERAAMTQSDDVVAFGPFRLCAATRTLTREGEPVPLTSKAFDTLLVLVRNRDRVVEKEELVKLVWPDAFVSDDSLT